MPLCPKLIRTIIAKQDPDGGWGDLMLTALCIRALSINNGSGDAVCRAIHFLANMQQPTGIWPRIPIRRMPHDAFAVSAFILLQLGRQSSLPQCRQYLRCHRVVPSRTNLNATPPPAPSGATPA